MGPLLFILVFGESQINDAVAITLFEAASRPHTLVLVHQSDRSRSEPGEVGGGEESSPEDGPPRPAPHLRGPVELVHQVGLANGHPSGSLTSSKRENQGCYQPPMCHIIKRSASRGRDVFRPQHIYSSCIRRFYSRIKSSSL